MLSSEIKTFHGYADREVAQFAFQPKLIDIALLFPKRRITQSRQLSYRFFPHFHPYVTQLRTRLVQQSMRGLEAADTEYVLNADGTYAVQPGSIQVSLEAEILVTPPGGVELKVLRGTRVTLPDATVVKLADGTSAALPGNMVVTQPRGLRVVIGGTIREIPFGSTMTLVNGTSIVLPSGASVILPGGTLLSFLSCKPRPSWYADLFSSYKPSEIVQLPYPAADLDFTSNGAYSVYNWELFFHAPITVAIHLSKNQRFQEAQKWFHYIFDPTDDSDGPTPERFWKVKPFQFSDVRMVEELLINLSDGADPALREETYQSIAAWKDAPFRPHAVARYRPSAYMFKTVMAYLDNLIAWGDTLFRQDTGESINEAMQLYVLAANILGTRPQAVPKKGSVRTQTYASLRKDLSEFGNSLGTFESEIPFDLAPHPTEVANNEQIGAMSSIGNSLYFCIPRNDILMRYWDTVADRLFKIRNSLNLQGIFRQLALFEPPIDPALLARAAAAGLDVGAIVNGANQPLPLIRFQLLIQKAAEICQEVKSLGNQLLAAIEKEDNEAVSLLRARHESIILGMAESVRYGQLQEAIKAREGLEASLGNAVQRYSYYERQLGVKDSDIKIPELDPLDIKTLGLDKNRLENPKFSSAEPTMPFREIAIDIVQGVAGGGADIAGGKKISSHEFEELNLLEAAQFLQDAAAIADNIGSGLSLIPQIGGKVQPLGAGVDVTFGGQQLHTMFAATASGLRAVAGRISYEGSRTAKIGSYARREQDWAFQSNAAAGEITQLFKQLRGAQIREAIAGREWKNHQQQMKHAADMEQFLQGELTVIGDSKHKKTSTQSLYTWMKREVQGLYSQFFQFAFDIAKKAERALQHELGSPDSGYLQYSYLAGKQGLLAGEKLYFDIKRMEMAYHELNRREYELTKHVSLLQVNPLALLQLRTTGRCTVVVPEELFDMDAPGHFFRRIKAVSVSMPCVTGPFTSVNCTLTLLKSSIRKNAVVGDGYLRTGLDDDRFDNHFGSLQAIVTSTAQNDSGLFETNLRDERYLPFEGSGVVSEWQLELPSEVRQFDYGTISDVILQIRYTAREGGELLRKGAVNNLRDTMQTLGSVRLFSLRHDFPTEWAKFLHQTPVANHRFSLLVNLRQEHYPFWSQGRLNSVTRVGLFGRSSKASPPVKIVVADKSGLSDAAALTDSLVQDKAMGNLLVGKLASISLPANPVGKLQLFFDDNSMSDLWILVTWNE